MNAETFNSLHKVGTPVFAYPACRPEDCPNDPRLVTRTRSKAEVLGGHTDVVWVDGHSSCIALDHVDVVSKDEWEAAKTAEAVRAEGALPMPAGLVRLSDERLYEYAALIKRTTPIGAVTASPGVLNALLAELDAVRAERDQALTRVADATEYGIRIPDGSVLSPTTSLSEERARLDRYRDCWPEAVLVQRPVFRGEWTEATS